MKVLLSIKPQFVDEIVNGNKKVEYRKRIFNETVDTVIIYSSMPVGKIIGEFNVGKISLNSPEKLWKETKQFSGITKSFFLSYFEGKKEAFAIQIKNFRQYDEPINPYEILHHFVPPQSYKYLNDSEYMNLMIHST